MSRARRTATVFLSMHAASSAHDFLNNFAFDWGNADPDFERADANFPGLVKDLDVDWGVAIGLTGV